MYRILPFLSVVILAVPTTGMCQSSGNDMSIPFFPMHVGDIFQYYCDCYSVGGEYSSYFTHVFTKDTTIGGIKYLKSRIYYLDAYFGPWNPPDSGYSEQLMRTNGKDTVFVRYFNDTTGDHVYFIGHKTDTTDSLISYSSTDTTIEYDTVRLEKGTWFNDSVAYQVSLQKIIRSSNNYQYYDFSGEQYADKFGEVGYWGGGNEVDNSGYGYNLVYCKINGVEYGKLLYPVGIVSAMQNRNPIQLSEYPNPATNELHVSLTGVYGRSIPVEIINVLGQKIGSPAVLNSDRNDITISTQDIPNGVYYLRCDSKTTMIVVKK